MKWVIKNPAPSDSRREKWGDFHFGRSLTKYLTRLGQDVETHYDPSWDTDARCDVVLVLRGKYPFPGAPGQHEGALRVMWNISHPADVPVEEYDSYDIVFVASRTWADRLRPLTSTPVFPLLQCTDAEEFAEPAESAAPRRDVVFIGNTREAERPGVLWALEYGLPVKIWGRGWKKWLPAGTRVVGDYVPNQELGALYAGAQATLNDHWDDMKEYGFVNNRIFDALACGLPVVSDWHEELEQVLPRGGTLLYRDREEFERCMETLLLEHPRLLREAQAAGAEVRAEHSFERRAEQLLDLATMAVDVRRGRPLVLETPEDLGRHVGTSPRYCPVCRTPAQEFRAFGVAKRPDAKCPHCGALERHRLLWTWFVARTDLFDGRRKSLLHVAPERYFAPLLWQVPGLDYVSADLESTSAMQRLDLTAAQYADESFDVIVCNHVLEHIPDDAAAMRELYRMLKPGGWAVLQVPMRGAVTDEDPSVTDAAERVRRFGQADHVRMYGKDYADRLRAAGFELTVDRFARELDPATAELCGIKDQAVYWCRRPTAP